MSWIYSVVLAGLMFTAGGDTVSNAIYTNNKLNAPTRVVLADESERFEQTYPLSANGRVSVSNINGSITVEAWDRNEVKLEAVKTADSKETLAEVEIQIDSKPEYITVEANYDHWKNGRGRDDWKQGKKLEISFKLMVPRTAVLDEIETVNGSVMVSNFTNQTKVSAVNGEVTAKNLRGAANLSTVNGTVTADFDRLEQGSKINLSTVNGHVNLALPSDSNTTLRASSVNGSITNEFGLQVRKGKYVGRDLYGKVGTGDVQVKLSSVNGGLAIGRKKDGKTPGPVTDLLPKLEQDEDEDWDEDTSENDNDNDNRPGRVHIDTAKMNKQIEKGMKQAQKELKNVKPNVEIDMKEIEKAIESVKLNEKAIREQVREKLDKQRETMDQMRDARWEGRMPAIEKKTNSFTVKGVPKVTIDAKDCGVKVSGWDKQEVKYVITRIGSNRSPNAFTVTEDQNSNGVNLKVVSSDSSADDDGFFGDTGRTRVEVFVPKKSDMKIVTNGEIRLEGVTGELDLSGADEAINVRDSGGKLQLASGDARVRIIGFNGALNATAREGDLFLEGDFENLTASTRDGHIIFTLPASGNADIEADIEAITIKDLPVPQEMKQGQWRFGKGGAKYKFTVGDGEVVVRNSSSVLAN